MGINDKQKVHSDIPPITYGVWIEDQGWLRDSLGRHFADPRIGYARAALRMWKIGGGKPARIELIDESMIGLQDVFLQRERAHYATLESNKTTPMRIKLRRLIYGLLG